MSIVNPTGVPPIPTKRPKVITKFQTTDQTDLKDSPIESDMNLFKSGNLKKDDCIIVTTSTGITSSDDPSTTFDPNMPSCSYQTHSSSSTHSSSAASASTSFNSFKYPTAANKSGVFQRKATASNATISAIKLRTNIESRSLRKSSLTKDGRRMKKKKTLKADTGLKRKKSKVF